MKVLPKPLQDKNAVDIFIECVDSYTLESARESKKKYVFQVEKYSNDYDTYIPGDIEHFNHPDLNKEQTEELGQVYKDKFSKDGAIGRKYYDIIMAGAKGVCPICGTGTPSHLDHYLPKSEYATLVVTPVNLIPTCRDCNMEKGRYHARESSMLPFHPYYDSVQLQWLEMKMNFWEDGTFSGEFYNGIDSVGHPLEKQRVDAHMKVHNLEKTLSSKVLTELDSIKYRHRKMLMNSTVEDLRTELEEMRESAECDDINSWKSALYRALERQVAEYAEWLSLI